MLISFKRLNELLSPLAVIWALDLHCRYVIGNRWRGECPFHDSSSRRPRSLKIDLDIHYWYCHKCKNSGDLIDLWAMRRGLSVREAAVEMAREFKIDTEQRRGMV